MRKNGKVRYDSKGRKLPDNISERPDRTYQIRFVVSGEQIVEYAKELGEAKEKRLEMIAKIAAGSIDSLKSLTLNEWYFKWLENYKRIKLKQRTYNNYVNYYNKNVRDTPVGKMKIAKIRQIHLVSLYKELTEREDKPLAHDTVVYINTMVGSCLQQAFDNDLITKNPAVGATKNVGGRKEKRRIALSEEQERIFLDFITEGRYAVYKPMFTVFFKTGLRSGELRALTEDDVNLDEELIIVDKSVNYDVQKDRNHKEHYITPPKTDSSNRPIPMLSGVKEAFLEQQKYRELFGIDGSYSIRRFDDKNNFIGRCQGFIFTTSKGTIATDESVNRTIKAIVNEYNRKELKKAAEENRKPILLPVFTMHVTRHSYTSRSYEKGMRGPSISASLGHKSEKTTQTVYNHIDVGTLRRDMKAAYGE